MMSAPCSQSLILDPGISSRCHGRKQIRPEHFQEIAAEKAPVKPDTPAATAAQNAAPLSKTVVYSFLGFDWQSRGQLADQKGGNRKWD
jgi:hypothetical protein